MSLLWSTAVQHEALPWHYDEGGPAKHPVVHSVKKAGFAGYVDNEDDIRTLHEDEQHKRKERGDDDLFDEDAYNESTPDPTPDEAAHMEEHDEYPDSFYERHDAAYQKAKEDKQKPDLPDVDDPQLMRFIGARGEHTDFWQKHAKLKPVDLTGPVHATQSHVSQTHIDRYLGNPGDLSDHQHQFGRGRSRYLGNEAPMFVTHQGRLHTTEGHHRVAAALARGDKSIMGWHYDLDKDPANHKGEREDEDDEDY